MRLNYNITPRSNLTNQLTLALNEWNSGNQAPGTWAGKSDWVSYLGIPGMAPNLKTEWPQIVINGSSWDGGGGASTNNQHTSILNDSVTWIKGRHTAKFGLQYMKGASNNLSTGRSAGYFNFLNQQTGLAHDFPLGCGTNSTPCLVTAGSTGIAFASFLLGYANEVQVDHENAPSYPRNAYWALFAQDDFKLSKRLTLNFGLRYDLFNPDYQKNNTKAWIDYSVPNPGAPGYMGALVTASAQDPSGLITYKTNFSPRLGLAYALNEKTVIRAAYGIFYAQGNEDRLDRGGFIQGYNGSTGITASGLSPAFIWGAPTSQMVSQLAFSPSQSPTEFNGGGTPKHSAGSLIAQDKTDSLPPYMNTYNFGVQRMLPGQMTLTVSYVGNIGIHLASRVTPWDKMPNQYLPYGFQTASNGATPLLLAPIGDPKVQVTAPIAKMPIDPATENHSPFPGFERVLGGAATMGQALKTSPQFQGTHRYYEGVGNSDYNALQVKLEKHFSNGLSLLASYAWSKTLTDGGSIFSTFSSDFGTDTPWNARLQKTYSFADLPALASISYVYDLPVGKGKRFLSQGGVANAIVGGWKYSGVLQYQSGMPQELEVGGRPGFTDQGWGRAIRGPWRTDGNTRG